MRRPCEPCRSTPLTLGRFGPLGRFLFLASLVLGISFGLLLGLGGARPAHAGDPSDADLPIAPGGPSAADEEEPAAPPEEEGTPQFFDEDIPTGSRSVVYVFDRSASMTLPVQPFVGEDGRMVLNGTRMDLARAELKRSIASLPDDWTFNIIIYSECIAQWRSDRQPATPQNKAAAFTYIDATQPWGWTNTGGAVARGLADSENLAIVLLSDGVPNFLDCAQTYVGDFDQHRQLIRTSNRQRATIDCFGIGLDPLAREFMQSVAAENNGKFREVQ